MKLLYSIYHFLWAWTGAILYRRPSKNLFVVGVTGTKGKSTTLELLNVILEEAGKKTAVLSSVSKKIDEEREENLSRNTMLGRWKIQRFLRQAVRAGCEYALLEVTSQGVTQYRHRFIGWDVAVLLNIHQEHIEAHGSYENYLQAKLAFFRSLESSKKPKKYFVVNGDDKEAGRFRAVGVGIPGSEIASFSKEDAKELVGEDSDWLRAGFNLENIAAAAEVARIVGSDEDAIKRGIEKFPGIAGRMEFVQKKPFSVIVDYAHTPDSLEAVYKSLRENYGLGKRDRLICVFGSAGGGRDKWKRPKLGEVAAKYCDTIVLTSEDPYDEDPARIMEEIESGFSQTAENKSRAIKHLKILDRKEAIKKAVALAGSGDMVVTTGMGNQPWFYGPHGKKVSWREPELVKKLLHDF